MCNTDGHKGPYSVPCDQVSSYAYTGLTNGTDITTTCHNAGDLVAGQAYDISGNWNVITGKANCKDNADVSPAHQ